MRRLNAYLDTIAAEISAKAAGIEQERQERAALESAHAVLQESVADLRAQLSRVQDHYEQAQAELQRSARQAGALQKTIQDQKQQVWVDMIALHDCPTTSITCLQRTTSQIQSMNKCAALDFLHRLSASLISYIAIRCEYAYLKIA